ncbi:hypothetical protein QFC21_006153 [Naganishia friedmannii]|uniref:Uncharacterized protein n=1 Tax=Naganishia friedmannii TaxID=89922 RepID=A0ACC2V631_9TREE|nr:hypothetical protein QFC21_006153 [Naganishia friedmannii]
MPLRTVIHLPTSTSTDSAPAHLKPTDVNLLPFHLAGYTGPAALDVYFSPRPSAHISGLGHQAPSSTTAANNGEEEELDVKEGYTGRLAAFRGRQVYEHLLSLPEGYTGVVFAAPPPPSGHGQTEDVLPAATNDVPLPSSPPRKTTTGGEVTPRRSSRKRKVAGEYVIGSGKKEAAVVVLVPAKRTRVKKPVERFSLDDDEDDDDEDEDKEEVANFQDLKPESTFAALDREKDQHMEADEQGEETQVEVHVVIDVPLPKPHSNGLPAAADDTQRLRQKLEKGDSLVVVDEALGDISSGLGTSYPDAIGIVSSVPASVTDAHAAEPSTDNQMDDITLVNTHLEEDTQSPTHMDTQTDDHRQSAINTRHLRARATFSGITIWSADEPMYSLPINSANGNETGVGSREAQQGGGELKAEEADVDVKTMMGERDEFARVLQEWRRLAGVGTFAAGKAKKGAKAVMRAGRLRSSTTTMKLHQGSGTLDQNHEPPTSATCKYDEAAYAQLHTRRSLGFNPAKHEKGYHKFLDQLGEDGAMRMAGPGHQAEVEKYFSPEVTKNSRWRTTGNDRISFESRGPDRRQRSIRNEDTRDRVERQVGKSREYKGRRVLGKARNLMGFNAWGRQGSRTPLRK